MRCYPHFTLLMLRSPGFGSTECDWIALLRLAFAAAPLLLQLNLATSRNSPDHSAKGTPSPIIPCGQRAMTVCMHFVSGTISLPSRGTFHLSLTVLFTIGHQVVFSLAPWLARLPTEFHVLRGTRETDLRSQVTFRIRGYHPLWLAFPGHSSKLLIGNSSAAPYGHAVHSHNPHHTTHTGLTCDRFRLFRFRSPLLPEYLFLQVLRCFTSLGSLRIPMNSVCDDRGLLCPVSRFGYLGINAC
jgi:hypothetical protein